RSLSNLFGDASGKFVFELQLRIAGYLDSIGLPHIEAGKQLWQRHADDVIQKDDVMPAVVRRHPDETLYGWARHLDDANPRRLGGKTDALLLRPQLHGQVDLPVLEEGRRLCPEHVRVNVLSNVLIEIASKVGPL